MTTNRRILLTLVAVLDLACAAGVTKAPPPAVPAPAARSAAAAPVAAAAPADLAASVPLDPAVRTGRLANGLTWYVRANHKPEKRAELRLVLDAGSMQEDDDQRGLAHFVEHMAFNGTRRFAKQQLIDYLERIGMRFGPDLNAYTSFDETVYMLQVPTDDEAILGTAFEILEDWAHGILFEDVEVDRERGVVIEEWRQGRGVGGRIRDRQIPVVYHGSRYADRLPIGDKATLETFPAEAVRRFYRDWYRPDLMAVVAVGDFDPQAIEARIRERFAGLAAPPAPRPRVDAPVPDHAETLVSSVTDPEATSISISVGFKRPVPPRGTLGDLRQSLVDALYHAMVSQRLRELSQKADPPFQFAFAGAGGLGRTKSMYNLFAAVSDGGVERGLTTLLTEARRVERHGFNASELERTKTLFLRRLEREFDERDKLESDRLAAEYVELFLEDEPAPGPEYALRVARELFPGIALAEIDARADQWLTEGNRVILTSGPDTAAAGIPDGAALLAAYEAARRIDVEPWVDQVRDEPLVARPPTPGQVVASESVPELGLTRWRLSNGVTVLLKPTAFKNDEVVLRGFSPGGHSLAPDAAFLSAESCAEIAAQMGAGTFSAIELGKKLAGKVASASAFVAELSEGLRGSASPRDLPTMFELLYLRFTGTRMDEEAWQAYLKRTTGRLQNQEAAPSFAFNRRWAEVTTRDHPRRRLLTVERLLELDAGQALAFCDQRFADASDFLFTIVGNFELEGIRPLVERWLGGLPAIGRRETWRDVGVEPPSGVERFEVRRGIEPKSQVRLMFHGEAPYGELDDHLATSLAEALGIRLREVLREDLGGVYGVGVNGGLSREPRQRYGMIVSFGCDPGRVDELIAAVFHEIEQFRTAGPPPEIVAKVREAQTRERQTDLERNAFWAANLEYRERHGMDPRQILDYGNFVAALTVESLRDAAGRYLDPSRYVQGVLYPEP